MWAKHKGYLKIVFAVKFVFYINNMYTSIQLLILSFKLCFQSISNRLKNTFNIFKHN